MAESSNPNTAPDSALQVLSAVTFLSRAVAFLHRVQSLSFQVLSLSFRMLPLRKEKHVGSWLFDN
jgi:hypothetical protein